jgi:hypothetical protein
LASLQWKTLELWQRRAELGNSPSGARADQAHPLSPSATMCAGPTITQGDIKLRCVTRPDELRAMSMGPESAEEPAHRRDGSADLPHRLITRCAEM